MLGQVPPKNLQTLGLYEEYFFYKQRAISRDPVQFVVKVVAGMSEQEKKDERLKQILLQILLTWNVTSIMCLGVYCYGIWCSSSN